MRLHPLIAIFCMVLNVGLANGLEVRVHSVDESPIPNVVYDHNSEFPLEIQLELVGYTPNDLNILAWQTGLVITPMTGAVGSVKFQSVTRPNNSLNDFDPVAYNEESLPADATTIAGFDLPPGKQIQLGQNPPIADLSLSVSEAAIGRFLIAMLPHEVETLDNTSFWSTENPEQLFVPFENAVDPDGTIHLAVLEIVIATTSNGDFNKDSFVDAADYTVWRDGLGTTYEADDYNIWKANYGTEINTLVSAVPEPPLLAMVAVLCSVCLSTPIRSPRVRPFTL